MLFCVFKSYEKDSKINFFPISVLTAETYTEAYSQFLSMHFYNAGSYRLFEIRSRDFKTDKCPCFPLGGFDSSTCLYSRVFNWDDKGNFVSRSFFGFDSNITSGDPERLFLSILSGKGLPSSNDDVDSLSPEVF